MRIAELFYSVQGEGSLIGAPSFFIRTSGCNLRCRWCDTPYTSWNPEGEEMPAERILQAVEQSPAQYVVVTGGEPLIAREITALTEGLRALGRHITIETAGAAFAPVACDLMSISPKLSNSTPDGEWGAKHEARRTQPDLLRRLMALCEYQLKFVIATPEDAAEALALAADLGAERSRVIFMPEGVEPALLRERSLWLVETCKQEAVRFSPRLHVDLWGSRRGV